MLSTEVGIQPQQIYSQQPNATFSLKVRGNNNSIKRGGNKNPQVRVHRIPEQFDANGFGDYKQKEEEEKDQHFN